MRTRSRTLTIAVGIRRALAAVCTTALVAVGLVLASPTPASAASPSDFNAGYMISDQNFYNANAMTQAQIQSFLNAQIGTCTNSLCLNVYRQTTASRAQDRTVCNAYAGAANEPAAQIIFKVQQACGISARVILVTLQKEQGLVKKSAPTTGILERAMGYGCPDNNGGVCDANYYGFFNQVYWGAWQMKRYSTPDVFGGFWAGQSRYIQYHPNTACGSKLVAIKNSATAALYSYTPYTPDAQALASYPGIGGSCSSYGNRNFWFLYSDWFGSPTDTTGAYAISLAYDAAGGAGGVLGNAVGALDCPSSRTSCSQGYENGTIGWTKPAGAFGVSGMIGASYIARGGVAGDLGYPLSAPTSFAVSDNGGGVVQIFQGGYLYSSAAGVFKVQSGSAGEMAWIAQGWIRGSLGWPTADEVCDAKGCSQQFQHGVIGGPKGGGSFVVSGVIGDSYIVRGGPTGSLGYPTAVASSFAVPANGDGVVQIFQGGYLYSSAAGVFKMEHKSAIEAAWIATGWIRGALGWPMADKVCDAKGCSQQFQHGTVTAGPVSPSSSVSDPKIAAAYAAAGGPEGSLGYPKGASSSFAVPANGDGVVQIFQGGYLYSSAAGVFRMDHKSPIETAWIATGWIRGSLGWPVGEKVCGLAGGGCSQQFQNGTVAGSS